MDNANAKFRQQKAALTRAKNSGDPLKVLAACRDAVSQWEEDGPWPDAWRTWAVAAEDALRDLRRDLWELVR